MGVEIEDVALDKPAAVKAPAEPKEPAAKQPPAAPLANPKVRRVLLIAAIVAAAVAIGLFVYFHDRESTDDAQVDGHITPIASQIYGRVAEVLVKDNQPVKAGQVLVRIDDADY
jgi:membrane fusion protein, multidrug efflux system